MGERFSAYFIYLFCLSLNCLGSPGTFWFFNVFVSRCRTFSSR